MHTLYKVWRYCFSQKVRSTFVSVLLPKGTTKEWNYHGMQLDPSFVCPYCSRFGYRFIIQTYTSLKVEKCILYRYIVLQIKVAATSLYLMPSSLDRSGIISVLENMCSRTDGLSMPPLYQISQNLSVGNTVCSLMQMQEWGTRHGADALFAGHLLECFFHGRNDWLQTPVAASPCLHIRSKPR